jgi:ABC-type lipoprotein export system ATPase subunit/histidinol phosphatase-like PHP family hydrolase
MIVFDGINSGADFIRADLHIHSYGDGGSFDVVDATMTPEAIVDTAIAKGLSVIAITDHNEVLNVGRAIEHAKGKNILVIPGIEVSTTQGHLLVYFDAFSELRNFYGKLIVIDDKKRCNNGIVECLNFAEQYGGIGILAHIELASGFETMIGRFGLQIEDVFVHRNLLGLEISNKKSIDLYTDIDMHQDRKNLIKKRREVLGLNTDYDIPKVMSSDSHTLAKLGINADGDTKLTRLKMDYLSFHSFKVALYNASSRIRLEDFIPESIPRFIGIKIEGGLLDKQIVKLSNNLTCIIGGRGAGKSTLLECIRECSGNDSKSRVVDSDVWPEKISLIYQDETGQIHNLYREKNAKTVNSDDPTNGITKIPIESYGQGATADALQHSDQNPQILLEFLDSFIEISNLKSEDEEIRNLLITNQSEVNKLRVEVSNIPEVEKQKSINELKLEHLKKDKAGELVKYQTALLKERQVRTNIVNDLNALITKYKTIYSDRTVFKNFDLLSDNEIIIGKDFFKQVKTIVSEFGKTVEEKSQELNTALNQKVEVLKTQIAAWSGKEKDIQEQIDKKKTDLESKGIPFDIGKINQIATDMQHYSDQLIKLKNKETELIDKVSTRNELLARRAEVKRKIYGERYQFGKLINENLKNTVDGLFVNVKYEQGKYSPQFENEIKTAMQWRTSRAPKAEFLAKFTSCIEFATGVKKRNIKFLKDVVDNEEQRVFNDEDIQNILITIGKNYSYEDFESIAFEDRPFITVTKLVDNGSGGTKPITKSLSQLSLGQQQSILLAILLQSKSKVPLLIDQPEDNLDSEFIYKTIVTNLKKIKEKRQVIIVTHNANIAVLGDAELIVPLKSTNVKSVIIDRGSIDRSETINICCETLEGGKTAFTKRRDIYGIK